MPHMIHFNTNRYYSRQGQRITAIIKDSVGTVFIDHDRGITGLIPLVETVDPRVIMHLYDRGNYQDTSFPLPDNIKNVRLDEIDFKSTYISRT